MSVQGIGSNAATSAISSIVNANGSGSATGGGVTYGVGSGAAGAYIAQPNNGSLVKKLLAGGVVGAGLGFAASFIPGLSFIPHFKLVLPAAGAAIGMIAGAIMHVRGKNQLAMQATPDAMPPTNVAPLAGRTLHIGARGAEARKLQTDLKTLGMYTGKVTGTFDRALAMSIRKYEVMKGVKPTGAGSPEVRAAIAQDATLARRYV